MSSSNSIKVNLLVAKAAYLYSTGIKEENIATRLGKDISQISRYINIARKAGLLRLQFDASKLPPEIRSEHYQTSNNNDLSKALTEKLSGKGLKSVSIFNSNKNGVGDSNFPARLKFFSENAASRFIEILLQSKLAGITWGETLSALVNEVQNGVTNREILGSKARKFIPVTGDPMGEGISGLSSTLAHHLNSVFANPGSDFKISLAGIPLVLPLSLESDVRKLFFDLFGKSDDYRKIFLSSKTNNSLVSQIDCLITSFGQASRPMRVFGEGIFDRTESGLTKDLKRTITRLRSLTHGDVGGLLVTKDNLSKEETDLIAQYEKSWTGIGWDTVKKLSNRAEKENIPGVVIIAMDGSKAECLFHLIERRVCNHLIIDNELANSIDSRF